MMTLLEISDVAGKPKVKTNLPQCQIGHRIQLHFCLRRKNAGRTEVLDVRGQFRVMAAGLDAASMPQRQVLSVESVGASPSWHAVKKNAEWKRVLPPAKAPRMVLE
jgi:hypothetical protein